MSLLSVILTLLVGGVFLWLVNSYVPMNPKVRQVINIAVAVAVILWLLIGFGVPGHAGVPVAR